MPATIRVMSWNLKNYGTTRAAQYDLAPLIAKVMQQHAIDICALLEIVTPSSPAIAFAIVTALNNLPTAYHRNTWQHRYVDVGDESVVYIWHEAPAGPNAFRGWRYTNNPAQTIAGPVIKNATGAKIYFPKTQTTWSSLPGVPDGRRPAYCAFETNDADPPRRFSVLDIHTPFAAHSIQTYSAHLYATSREMTTVETVDFDFATTQAQAAALAAARTAVNALALPDGMVLPAFGAAVDAVRQEIGAALLTGVDLRTALFRAGRQGVRVAADAFGVSMGTTRTEAAFIAECAAFIGGVAATHLVATVQRPTAPVATTAAAAVALVLEDLRTEDVRAAYGHPAKRSASAFLVAIKEAATDALEAVWKDFAFADLPTSPLQGAVLGGDFNVPYPDTTVYTGISGASKALGVDANGNIHTAYSRLLARTVPVNTPAVTARTTIIGPEAFAQQRLYQLRVDGGGQPLIQHTDSTLPTYVPLNVTSLIGVRCVGYDDWFNRLKGLAQAQSVVWATLIADYSDQINRAFDSETVLSGMQYFAKSAYDNLFVNAPITANRGVIDVLSALGTWLVPGHGLWPAATQTLQVVVNPHITAMVQRQFWGYDITPLLQDAQEAAVFYSQFVSDHFPVYVEIQI